MTAAVPMKIVWFVTGNGLIIGADTARRAIIARLEPTTDHPEDRTGPRPGQPWRYPDLLGYASEHRAELLGYALTVIKAYIQNGSPDMKLTPMGSFEAWSNTIRSAIVYAGAPDPCATIADARKADLQDHALRMMVECWPVANNVEVTASSLIAWADVQPNTNPNYPNYSEQTTPSAREMWKAALLEWLPAKKGELPTARELGYALRAIKGSIIGDFKIEAGELLKSGVPWKRIRVNGSDDNAESVDNKSLVSLVR
jgi:hypothetical protein